MVTSGYSPFHDARPRYASRTMPAPLLERLYLLRLSGTAAGNVLVACGRCMRDSPHLADGTKREVWTALEALGWRWEVPPVGGCGHAICAACAALPPVDLAQAHAMKKKTRRR
jgi:hypothetical protein